MGRLPAAASVAKTRAIATASIPRVSRVPAPCSRGRRLAVGVVSSFRGRTGPPAPTSCGSIVRRVQTCDSLAGWRMVGWLAAGDGVHATMRSAGRRLQGSLIWFRGGPSQEQAASATRAPSPCGCCRRAGPGRCPWARTRPRHTASTGGAPAPGAPLLVRQLGGPCAASEDAPPVGSRTTSPRPLSRGLPRSCRCERGGPRCGRAQPQGPLLGDRRHRP